MAKKKKKKKVQEPNSIQAEPQARRVEKVSKISLPKWLVLVFIAASFLLYFQSINYDFILDDKIVYAENNYTTSGFSGIYDILTKDTYAGFFGEQDDLIQGGRYRPLSMVSFALENQFFGLNPKVAHIVNILLYGICAWLIVLVLSQLLTHKEKGFSWWGIPLVAALIYLFHPVHTEAVANIKGRDEIMAMLFGLLCLRHALNYADGKGFTQLVLMAVFFFLGLLSKENVITFLAVIPLAILMFRKVPMKRTLTPLGVLGAATGLYLLLRWQVVGYIIDDREVTSIMNNPFVGMTGAEKYGSIFYTLFEYLRLSIFPHPLTHDYFPYHIPKVGFEHWKVFLSLLLHAGLIIYSLLAFKKNKVVSFGIWFYIITLSIVSNLVVGVGTFMNERFIFISSLGACLIMAWLLVKAGNKWNPRVFQVLTLVILVLYGAKTMQRVPAWKNEMTLNQAAVKVSKNSARANSFMATALFQEFQSADSRDDKLSLLTEAKGYSDKAVRVLPNYGNGNLMKAGIYAELYRLDSDLPALFKGFNEVVANRPQLSYIEEYCTYLIDRVGSTEVIDFYHDAGYNTLFKKKGKVDWGIHYLLLAEKIDPTNTKVRAALAECYTAFNQPAKAAEYR